MPIDWIQIDQKRQSLGKAPYDPQLKAELEHEVADILGISQSDRESPWGAAVGYGCRSLALIAPNGAVQHKFSKHGAVQVKVFQGRGKPGKAKDFLRYHGTDFPQLESLRNPRIQQSIQAGSFKSVVHYAVLSYHPGALLRDFLDAPTVLPKAEALEILLDLFKAVWIPLWASGLRFKDCHPGNFILTPDKRIVMIDSEQMRKDLHELLETPTDWTQRDKHELSAIKKLPKLLEAFTKKSGHRTPANAIKTMPVFQKWTESLAALGRDQAPQEVLLTTEGFLKGLFENDR